MEIDGKGLSIHLNWTCRLLWFAEVLREEREFGQEMYDQDTECVKDTVAFGRRSEGPPNLFYPRDIEPKKPTKPLDYEVGNNFYRDKYVTFFGSKKLVLLHQYLFLPQQYVQD